LESALTYQPYLNKILHLPFHGRFYGHGQIYGHFLNKQEKLKKNYANAKASTFAIRTEQPHIAKIAKELTFLTFNESTIRRGMPITSGLNASRGELHRLNFCAIFEVRFSHQQ
jgi:hypothetical protein